jgi:hypothetical protein
LRQLDESGLSKLIVEMVLLGSVESASQDETDALTTTAKRHRVDVTKVRTAVGSGGFRQASEGSGEAEESRFQKSSESPESSINAASFDRRPVSLDAYLSSVRPSSEAISYMRFIR